MKRSPPPPRRQSGRHILKARGLKNTPATAIEVSEGSASDTSAEDSHLSHGCQEVISDTEVILQAVTASDENVDTRSVGDDIDIVASVGVDGFDDGADETASDQFFDDVPDHIVPDSAPDTHADAVPDPTSDTATATEPDVIPTADHTEPISVPQPEVPSYPYLFVINFLPLTYLFLQVVPSSEPSSKPIVPDPSVPDPSVIRPPVAPEPFRDVLRDLDFLFFGGYRPAFLRPAPGPAQPESEIDTTRARLRYLLATMTGPLSSLPSSERSEILAGLSILASSGSFPQLEEARTQVADLLPAYDQQVTATRQLEETIEAFRVRQDEYTASISIKSPL